jgi:hypothetical protein
MWFIEITTNPKEIKKNFQIEKDFLLLDEGLTRKVDSDT